MDQEAAGENHERFRTWVHGQQESQSRRTVAQDKDTATNDVIAEGRVETSFEPNDRHTQYRQECHPRIDRSFSGLSTQNETSNVQDPLEH